MRLRGRFVAAQALEVIGRRPGAEGGGPLMRRGATAEAAIDGGIVGASGRNYAAELRLRAPPSRSSGRVWLGDGCSYLAEAYDHGLEVAKHDATYHRQEHSADDNHEREY